jgi:hypothetical protein
MIDLAMRALPAKSRENDGLAIYSLAMDMVEGGSSSIAQAGGIASYGVKKRLLLNFEWVRELPWRSALWMLALPIASVQAVMLLLSSGVFDQAGDFQLWPGKWNVAVFAMVGLTLVGAARRRRFPLLTGALGLLALLVIDEYAPGGGMVAGMSHTQDFSIPNMSSSVLAPVALILIPTTILLLAAGSLRPPVAKSPRHSKYIALSALMIVGFAASMPFQYKLRDPAIIYSSLGVAFVVVGVIAITVFAVWRDRPDAGLAAGLLLGSQTLLLGCQLMYSNIHLFDGILNASIPSLIAYLAMAFVVPIAVAFGIIRYAAGPRRLP